MKKVIIFILFILFMTSLYGCTNDSDIPDDENNDGGGDIIDDEDKEDEEEDEPTEEELIHQKIMDIIDSLTVEEKIGQLFIVGFSGKNVSNSLIQAVNNYHFGNFIYFGENVENNAMIAKMSDDIQDLVLGDVGIPAFIAMDHEGGMVVRLTENATHFLGNMGLAATFNPQNAYTAGKLSGSELRHYGINFNFAPVLDVNNNPNNPVIGIRSFSDDPKVVSSFGLKLIEGYKEVNVLTSAKHFPGHGDTITDSHYGLPLIPHSKERLFAVELAPFIDAINAGIDAIMSAHIIFSSFDSENPATLSYKVLTELLRNELGFKGLIITDEMRMQAIRDNFGVGEAAIKALKAGADLLLYAESTSTSVEAYNGVLNAVRSGEITEERLNKSLYRVLTKKIKYNLFDDYKAKLNLTHDDINNHKEINRKLLEDSVTIAKGSIDWFDKSKSTLLISTRSTRYPLLPGYNINSNDNSFAVVGKNYLKTKGVNTVESYVIGTSINNNELNQIKNLAGNYDQIVIALENVSSSQAKLVNDLANQNAKVIVVALRNPYDYLSYSNVNNYICSYGYFSDAVFVVLDLLLGEATAKGKLPVKVNGLN